MDEESEHSELTVGKNGSKVKLKKLHGGGSGEGGKRQNVEEALTITPAKQRNKGKKEEEEN